MTKILTNRFVRSLAYSVLSPATLFAVPVYAQTTAQSRRDDAAAPI